MPATVNRSWTSALAVVVCVGGPAAAFAQTPQPSVFVLGAGGLAWASPGINVATGSRVTQDHRTTPSGLVGVGVRLRGPVTIRFELGLQGTTQFASTLVSSTFGATATTDLTSQRRSRTFSALVGYRTRLRGRLEIEFLGGLTVAAQRVDQTVASAVTVSLPVALNPVVTATSETVYRNAPELGVDVRIRAGAHVSIAPMVRLYAAGDSATIVAAAGVFWRF